MGKDLSMLFLFQKAKMKKGVLLSIIAASIACTFLVSCSKDDCPEPSNPGSGMNFDRQALLANIAEIITLAHADHNTNINALSEAMTNFTGQPDLGTLSALKLTWRQTLLDWQSVAPYEFGEAVNQSFEVTHNTYPVDSSLILNNIINGGYNLDAASNNDAIGLQAMDYLLHGHNETSTLQLFTTDIHAQQRLQYLTDLITQLKGRSDILTAVWQNGSSQVNDFVTNDGTDVGSSIGLFLNAFIKSYERNTRANKLGIPSGAFTFSMTPLPGHVEAFYENTHSIEYLKASIQVFKNIYLGGAGIGLDDYLIALNAQHNGITLDQAIQNQFDQVETDLELLQTPLSDFLVNDQQTALNVYAELQELVVLFKVDMMSALGVLVTFQDNDGD